MAVVVLLLLLLLVLQQILKFLESAVVIARQGDNARVVVRHTGWAVLAQPGFPDPTSSTSKASPSGKTSGRDMFLAAFSLKSLGKRTISAHGC